MRPAGRHRPERVAALVQETLADTIATRVKDPRVGFVTITGVEVSADCTHATVRVSVMGSEEEKARAMDGLASAKGFLRTRLAQTLSLRTTPELHFLLDRSLEHAARVERILAELKDEERS
jgi:ribosome-binding factor A